MCYNLATLRCSSFCVSAWRRALVDSSSSCCCSVKPQAPPTHRAEVRALLCAPHSPCQSTATHTHWCLSASPEPFTWESLPRNASPYPGADVNQVYAWLVLSLPVSQSMWRWSWPIKSPCSHQRMSEMQEPPSEAPRAEKGERKEEVWLLSLSLWTDHTLF